MLYVDKKQVDIGNPRKINKHLPRNWCKFTGKGFHINDLQVPGVFLRSWCRRSCIFDCYSIIFIMIFSNVMGVIWLYSQRVALSCWVGSNDQLIIKVFKFRNLKCWMLFRWENLLEWERSGEICRKNMERILS